MRHGDGQVTLSKVASPTPHGDRGAETARDKWERLRPAWSKRFLLDPVAPGRGTWLDSKWEKGLAVGCKCCRAADLRTPFGAYRVDTVAGLQAVNFIKHASNSKHIAAVDAYLRGTSVAARISLNCPSEAEFTATAEDITTGGTIGHSAKRRMAWCLNEAIKEQDRDIISSAVASALFRDERKKAGSSCATRP